MKTKQHRAQVRRVPRWPGVFKPAQVAALFALAAAGLSASPLQHPKRLLSVYTVDLGPLFKWWSKHEGPRPLPAWVRISGSVVGTNVAGWILEADVEKTARNRLEDKDSAGSAAGRQRIILRNPPVDDLVEFEELSSKLSALNARRSSLAAEENDAKSREQAVAEQQRAVRRNSSRSRVLTLEDRQLKQEENQAKAQEKPLDEQIQELKSKLAGYPNRDNYILDCFALDLQSEYEHLPVFDHGQVMK